MADRHVSLRAAGEIRSLTGLRGLAALLVIVAHYWQWARVTTADVLPTDMEQWTNTSSIGMGVFFTLSGFVIALSYSAWDWRARPAFNLVRLFFYRFARLYPAFLVFVATVLLWRPQLHDLSNPATRDYLLPHLLLWQSWGPVKFGGELAANDYFHVSWSLSVECALYLAFGVGAIVVAALPAWRHKALVLGTLCFATVWMAVDAAWTWREVLTPAGWTDTDWLLWLFHYSPCAVALQFGIGVAAYTIARGQLPPKVARLASQVGALGLIAIYVLLVTGWNDHFTESLAVALATATLMAGALSDSVVNRLLSGRAIVFVGMISYSLYLFHFVAPHLALHALSFDSYTATAATYHAVNILASLAFALVIATGVYHLVEVPGRRAIRAAADRILKPAVPLRRSRVEHP
jgi:peptidoglycan/LPS O-acetylase OafA/YrhL